MKSFAFISVFLLGLNVSAQECDLKFNGAYVYTSEDSTHGFNEFIRFYDDGEVITAISVYALTQSTGWFHRKDETVSQGSYEQEGCNIEFSTRSADAKYYYKGTIDGNFLQLRVLYPGKRNKEMVELEFYFQKVHLQ